MTFYSITFKVVEFILWKLDLVDAKIVWYHFAVLC